MNSPLYVWIDLAKLLLNPKKLLAGLVEFLFSWIYTRNWLLACAALPVLVCLVYIVGAAGFLRWVGTQRTVQNYWSVVEKDSTERSTLLRLEKELSSDDREPSPQASTDSMTGSEELSPTSAMLLRKILQLENSDRRAIYLIGFVLANQGRRGQARQLMRRIAPEGEDGFAPAHAWLAADRLQSFGVRDKQSYQTLVKDLSVACSWPGVSPLLLSVYADMLIQENKVDEAIEILREAGKRDSRFRIRLASLAKKTDQMWLLKSIADDMSPDRVKRIEQNQATESDFYELAALRLLEDHTEEAAKLAAFGLRNFPQSAQLKRTLSNAFLTEFEKVAKSSDGRIKMQLLDQAMRADPSNPPVMEKVAALAADGRLVDESMAEMFRKQLAEGKATAITHLLLAIGHLRRDDMEKALVHLELARGLAPNNPVILNNLALCLARTRPEELPKARKMIEFALTIANPDPELLDTYGEILMLQQEFVPAIRAFEAALSINGERPGTRKKLADAYTKVALDDMAKAVQRRKDSPSPIIDKEDLLQPKPAVPKDSSSPANEPGGNK